MECNRMTLFRVFPILSCFILMSFSAYATSPTEQSHLDFLEYQKSEFLEHASTQIYPDFVDLILRTYCPNEYLQQNFPERTHHQQAILFYTHEEKFTEL